MKPREFWAPFEEEIRSYSGLVKKISEVMKKAEAKDITFAWRGQTNADWPLHSSLYRRVSWTLGSPPNEKQFAKEEAEVLKRLHQWGLHCTQGAGRLSVLNQLAMLQHYGSPTRLIDISFNAWVAVWFAIEQKWDNGESKTDDSDVRLFAIDVSNRLINENHSLRAWEDNFSRPWGRFQAKKQKEWTTSVYAWKPPALNARISAQNGGFLFGGVPASTKPDGGRFQFPKGPGSSWRIEEGRQASSLALRPHLFHPTSGGVNTGALYTFRIKARAKVDIRKHLEQMFGYTHATLYSDFTGFSDFGTPWLRSRPVNE